MRSVPTTLLATTTLMIAFLLPWQAYGVIPIALQQRTATQNESPQLSSENKAELVALAKTRIGEVYAFPEEVPRIHAFLDERLAGGAYDDLNDGHRFAAELTADLRSFTKDSHFSVAYSPQRFEAIGAMEAGPNPSLRMFEPNSADDAGAEPAAAQIEALLGQFSRTNFNLRKIENLDGNVGYLRLGIIPPLDLARPTVDAAMQFLAYSDALILDLRGVPGGVGGFIPYLMSYVFPPDSLLLYERVFSFAGRTEQFHSWRSLPSPRLETQPVYVLVDAMTGSAAENLAYTLQQHGRATIVGEITSGGANSSSMAQLSDGFVMQLPIARVIHPVSKSNWDRTGVLPDVEANSSEALDTAHEAALTTLLASAPPEIRPELQNALDRLRNRETESAASTDYLAEYAGTFGSRTIHVRDGGIRYQREGGPQVRLVRLEGDLFQFDLDPNMRPAAPLPNIRFDRNEAGDVVSISAIDSEGTVVDVFPRTE